MIELNGIYTANRFADTSLGRREESAEAAFNEVLENGDVRNEPVAQAETEFTARSSDELLQGETPDVRTYTYTGRIEVYGTFSGMSINLEV